MTIEPIDIKPGDTRRLVVSHGLTRTQIAMYAGVSGDFNPLHSDEVYAQKVAGYPSVFAHGMLTMGLSSNVLTSWINATRIKRLGVRFARQVWPGDILTTVATVTAMTGEQIDINIETENQHAAKVLSGYAELELLDI